MNILIVNDSPMITALIRAVVETCPDYRVTGTAPNGKKGVEMALMHRDHPRPDLVLMDLHMPEMSGWNAVEKILVVAPDTRVLITTATVTRNIPLVFDCLRMGALDYVHSPSLAARPGTPVTKARLREAGRDLLAKIRLVMDMPVPRPGTLAGGRASPGRMRPMCPIRPAVSGTGRPAKMRYLGIGCSTGGPTTLLPLLRALPVPLSGPVLVCQHMDVPFVSGFVAWLNTNSGFPVCVVRDRVMPEPGTIYVAPGNKNLAVSASGRLMLERPPPGQFLTPNIDVLFCSMAAHLKAQAVAVILTGFGRDGAKGLKAVKAAGGRVYVQTPGSAVIPSMPETALAEAGLPDQGLSPGDIGFAIGREV